MMQNRLAVFVSGIGSTLKAIQDSGIEVSMVVADQQCPAIDVGRNQWWCRRLLAPRDMVKSPTGEFDQLRYTMNLKQVLEDERIDLVIMAGFLTILHEAIFEARPYWILNTHASLLPAFKGRRPALDAWKYGVKVSGCTLHYATKDLDAGPIIDQQVVRRREDDTFESFHERIKAEERRMVVINLKRMLAA